MDTRVRQRMTACVALLALLFLPTVATAAPSGGEDLGVTWSPLQLVDELVRRIGGWLDESPIRSVSAPGGHSMDPDGAPSPDLEGGGTVTTEGGPTMDPDG